MKSLILPDKAKLAVPAILRRNLGRFRTCDTSFTFRMGAGFAGDVNRGHPASILPKIIDTSVGPSPLYGQPCILVAATGGVRQFAAGDTGLTDSFGVVVRPYPIQQASNTNFSGAVPYGAISPPSLQPLDVLRAGYVMVQLPAGQTPQPGGLVYVWCAASGAGHTQGNFEASASGGNTAALASPKFFWNSPVDANGVAELGITV